MAVRTARGVVAAIAVWLAVTGLAGAADVDAARRAIGEMLSASRTMVESGERQNVAQMLAEAERVVMTGEQALAWLPQPGNRHARDAADHVRQAIDHAKQVIVAANHGRLDDALAEARRTLGQVRRGAGHAEAL